MPGVGRPCNPRRASPLTLGAQGGLEEAIAAYADILEPPHLTLSEGPTRMPQDEWPVLEVPAPFQQARLLEAVGNGTAAERRYRESLSHWGDADGGASRNSAASR